MWRQPNTKEDFLSGYFYYKKCEWSICPRYTNNFIISEIKDNDLVFINLDYFEQFLNFLRINNIKSKFILVTQNSDRDFTEKMFNEIDIYVNKILAINCTFTNKKVIKIPLGFNDHSTEILENENFDFIDKKNLVYMNFKVHHHPDRKKCYDYFSQFDWVTKESTISIEEFYKNLKTFKYCISPRGTGIDTHRLYECLLYGVIPIVTKSSLDDLYSNFPILLVDNWQDVNYEFLIKNYDYNLNQYFEWKKKNPDWYRSSSWIKK